MTFPATGKIRQIRAANGWRWYAELFAISGLAAMVYLWNIGGTERSEYYAAVVSSMSKSWKAWFFGALDANSSITLDKIPGSYWLTAIFVKLFGFSTQNLIIPNAIATIGTALVVAITAKYLYNELAGVIAGVVVIATPIVAAVARSNQPMPPFLFSLSLVAYFSIRALREQSRKWLIIAGLGIGLAFQMYMVEAWMVWPPLMLAYFFTKQARRKKIADILIAGTISLVSSLWWIVTVALIPAKNRPWIGGTSSNNPLEMVFGYNALGRFTIGGHPVAGVRRGAPPFAGQPSVFRFFHLGVSSQILWMIPIAIACALILFFLKEKREAAIFTGAWLIMFSAVLSELKGMHEFYLATLAIPMGLSIASGFVVLIGRKRYKLMALLVVLTSGLALFEAIKFPHYLPVLAPIQIALGIAFVALAFKINPDKASRNTRLVAATMALLAITLTPLGWSIDVKNHPNTYNPVAGPNFLAPDGLSGQLSQFLLSGKADYVETPSSKLLNALKDQPAIKYQIATLGAVEAAPYTTRGVKALPMGGFNGKDPWPTVSEIKSFVKRREVNYVVLSVDRHEKGKKKLLDDGVNPVVDKSAAWILAHCKPVVAPLKSPSSQLFMCQPNAPPLNW
jgi:4-amino-4-deoxy-L-arabinose transferase-like glycosyltransferase